MGGGGIGGIVSSPITVFQGFMLIVSSMNCLPNDYNLDWTKLKAVADHILALSQTTNFRLFQIERVCR